MTRSRQWLLGLAALGVAAIVLLPIYWMLLTSMLRAS